MSVYDVDKLMLEARKLAANYRQVTGKSLGISGEIAKFDVARLMDLELCSQPHTGGYDAIGNGIREGKTVQIKGRAIFNELKSGQRIGQIKLDQEWDIIMLLIMDENYAPMEIYETYRDTISKECGSDTKSRRKKRGAMSVAKFKAIGQLVWTQQDGNINADEIWDNQVKAK
jgi:hypothetical protein